MDYNNTKWMYHNSKWIYDYSKWIIIILNGCMISSSRLTSTQCLKHNWLQKLMKNDKSSGATIDMSRLKEHLRHKSLVSVIPYNIL